MSDYWPEWWAHAGPTNLYLDENDAIRDRWDPHLRDAEYPRRVIAADGPIPDDVCRLCWILPTFRGEAALRRCIHTRIRDPHFIRYLNLATPQGGCRYLVVGCLKPEGHDGRCWVERIERRDDRWIAWESLHPLDSWDGDTHAQTHARNSFLKAQGHIPIELLEAWRAAGEIA